MAQYDAPAPLAMDASNDGPCFSKSKRNKDVMLYKGFEYLVQREAKGVVHWRCRESRVCRCPAKTQSLNGVICREPGTHCHTNNIFKAEAEVAKSNMREAMGVLGATPRNVMVEGCKSLSLEVMAYYMPKQSSLLRNLRKHRQTTTLPNPGTPCPPSV